VVNECLAAGAKAFVLKRSAFTDLLAAVAAVLKGGTFISPAVALKQKMLTEKTPCSNRALKNNPLRLDSALHGFCNGGAIK
jgi:DNA-binding NarL/FixJ family response regulator